MIFRKLKNPSDFFKTLPEDWLDELLPGVIKDYQVISGGIVFNQNLPQLSPVEIQAALLFQGAPYIGYIYTQPEFRGMGASSFWFHSLFDQCKNQRYWLSIEDLQLSAFYQKFGFSIHEFEGQSLDEYVMFKAF
jgi:GNAT superfamily N-acetyltransferase